MGEIFGLTITTEEKRSAGALVGKLKSISDFLSSAVEATKEMKFPEAVAAVAPWAKVVAGAASEAAPPLKFIAELLSKITTEQNPEALGHLACVTAYERSIEQAFQSLGLPEGQRNGISGHARELEPSEQVDFKRFSYSSALSHPFIKQADRVLRYYSERAGYSEQQIDRIESAIHIRFLGNLKAVLFHGEARKKFEPFTSLMQSDVNQADAYSALAEHADFQRWLFEEAPLFPRERFALADVYVETDAKTLSWRQFDEMRQRSKGKGKRSEAQTDVGGEEGSAFQTVMNLIRNEDFRDAIVIQGPPGAGKSALTLRLSKTLIEEGLRPIRVRFRDLDLDLHISEGLPQAIQFTNQLHSRDKIAYPPPKDATLEGEIFKEHLWYGSLELCPYVLIFDGWDEVTISSREGFRQRIEQLLNQVRQQYLTNRTYPVRVILTGRPSDAIIGSGFFRSDTRFVELHPLTAPQLDELVAKIIEVTARPVLLPSDPEWKPDVERLRQMTDQYAKAPKSLDVLESPLLAYLAVRLVSESQSEVTV